jgi:hypothetical protein
MVVAALCVAAVSTPSIAQVSDTSRAPSIGERVRVFAPDLRTDRYIGRIQVLDGIVMVLDTGEVRSVLGISSGPILVDQYRRVTIRISNIEQVEVSGGRTVGGATVRGALMGSLAGGVLWGLGNMPQVNPGARDFVRAFPTGLAIGAVIGGIVGWGVGGERWLPARVPR